MTSSCFPARAAIATQALCLLVLALALIGFSAPVLASTPIPPLTSPVVDLTGTLDAAQIAQLDRQARELHQRKGSQLQILIVPSTHPEDIADYAQRVFDQWKIGRADADDGLLLVVAKDDRRVRIHTGYGLEGAIPDITAARVIQEYLVPKFRAGDFAGGIVDGSAVLVKLIDGEPLPEPMVAPEQGENFGRWFVALFMALVVSTGVRGMLMNARSSLRGLAVGVVAGATVWIIASLWWLALVAAVLGVLYGMMHIHLGHYAGSSDWGGYRSGGWGGSSSGGGWSGGGGSSGGGGASGSW